jgi:hypothetical protein
MARWMLHRCIAPRAKLKDRLGSMLSKKSANKQSPPKMSNNRIRNQGHLN